MRATRDLVLFRPPARAPAPAHGRFIAFRIRIAIKGQGCVSNLATLAHVGSGWESGAMALKIALDSTFQRQSSQTQRHNGDISVDLNYACKVKARSCPIRARSTLHATHAEESLGTRLCTIHCVERYKVFWR